MTNKKIKRATGNYTQELVNNQPVVPTVPVQNPTVAAGGNSYQAYVNEGAPTTPVQMRSVVTPVQNPTVQMKGQYTRNLVKPKQMKNEVGGVETGGVVVDTGGEKKKLEVEEYPSYIETLKEREESIVDQYNADINYAEQLKDDAYKKAEDEYSIAMREAQGNFRANQPTYGAMAEQLLASGLTGGGYSDYITGKAYEARTDEINAARSQQSYAQYLADSNYRDMMHQAEQDKFNRQDANDQWKLNYSVQLDAEYKAKVDEVLMEIKNGDINAAVAETKLKNYAPNGEISEDVLNALKTQEEEYWRNNNNSITTDFISWVAARQDAEKPVNAAGMRQWLKDNTNLTDNEVEFWIATYTDEDGNYQPPTNISYEVRNGNLWISTDGGKTWKDYGAISDKGGQGGDNPDNGGQGGTDDNTGLTDAVNYLRTKANMGKLDYASSYTAFKEAMAKHQIGNGEDYNKLINEMKQLVTQGKFDRTAAAAIENMTNGLVVGSGAFEKNRGLQKKFQKGDNFTVTVGGNSYKVDSAGEADGDVQAVANNLADGVVFGYGSELYLKSGNTAYKIKARALFGNKDYNELWKAVYGEVIDNIAKADVSSAKTDDEKLKAAQGGFVNPENKGNTTEKKTPFLDFMGTGKKQFNDGPSEDNSNNDSGSDNSNNDSGNGNNDETPPKDPTYLMDPAGNLGAKAGSAIGNWFKNLLGKKKEEGNPNDDNIAGGGTVTRGYDAKFKNDAWGAKKDLSAGDNFNITVNGKTRRVESGGKIDNQNLITTFDNAGIENGEVFEYYNQAYLKKDDNYYMIDTRFWHPMAEDKSVEAIKNNPNAPIAAAINLNATGTAKDDKGNKTEAQTFIKNSDGTGLLLLHTDNGSEGGLEITYEKIKDKNVPSGLVNAIQSNALVDKNAGINVVYWNGKFYLYDGKYYEITPINDEYKNALLEKMIKAED